MTRRGLRLPTHLTLWLVMVVWLVPVLGLVVTSFRTPGDVASSGWWTAFVKPWFTVTNYGSANTLFSLGGATASSLALAVPATVMTVLVSALGAYALARMRFAGRIVVLLVLVALLVTPPQLTLVPVLKLFTEIGLGGSTAVWLYQVGFTVPYGVFLVHGFFAAIPDEILEAARIDGCREFQIFWRIVLPTATPVLASLAMMQFIWSWNDLLIPLMFLGGNGPTVPFTVQLAGLMQQNGQGQEAVAAAALLSVLLPVAVVVFLQRWFVRGVLGGAVKG